MFTRFVLAAAILVSGSCQAQEESPIRGKVIGRIWHTNVSMQQMFGYMTELTSELELQKSPLMIMAGGAGIMNSIRNAPADVRGTLVFLETMPNTGTPHLIAFRNIESLEAFQKFVKEQAKQYGPMGELIGEDDRFEVRMNFENISMPTEESAEGERKGSFQIEIRSSISIGDSSDAPESPADSMPSSISTYYRYHDGIVYSGQLKALNSIDLPSGESMMPSEDSSGHDIHGAFQLSEIPKHVKDKTWMALSTQTSTLMQRYDNEAFGDYSLRHAFGKGKLELFKAGVFDIDAVDFSILLAEGPDTPLKAHATIKARDNSQLAKSLKQMNRSPSRLGALRDEESPLVVSTTFDLPEWTQPLAQNFVQSLAAKLNERLPESAEEIEALLAPLQQAMTDGTADGAARLEGDVESGMVLAGGIRLPSAEQFQNQLESLFLLHAVDFAGVAKGEIDGRRTLIINWHEWQPPSLKNPIPLQFHICGSNGYLWFAAGGENARDVLAANLKREQDVMDTRKRPLPLLVRMRLSDWLTKDAEGTTQVPRSLLTALERQMHTLASGMFNMSLSINGKQKTGSKSEFVSYQDKVLTGRSADLELVTEVAGSTLTADATIGAGVLKFLVAQYAAAQNRMFSNITFDFPEGLEKGEGTQIRAIQIQR